VRLRAFFDTSVIVSAFVKAHSRHKECLPWLQKVKNNEITGIMSSHSLLEAYSVLTTLPLSPRIGPSLALKLLKENLISCFEIINYGPDDNIRLLEELSGSGLAGGSTYDGFIIYAAKKANPDIILTLNLNDFLRVAPELVKIISLP